MFSARIYYLHSEVRPAILLLLSNCSLSLFSRMYEPGLILCTLFLLCPPARFSKQQIYGSLATNEHLVRFKQIVWKPSIALLYHFCSSRREFHKSSILLQVNPSLYYICWGPFPFCCYAERNSNSLSADVYTHTHHFSVT